MEGLVILQEIFGITDQLKGVVRGYARDGYDTIIPALYDRAAPGTVVPFNEPDRGRDLVLVPKQQGPPLNYFVYPYVEVDGQPWPSDRMTTAFDYEDLQPTTAPAADSSSNAR